MILFLFQDTKEVFHWTVIETICWDMSGKSLLSFNSYSISWHFDKPSLAFTDEMLVPILATVCDLLKQEMYHGRIYKIMRN